MARQTVFLIGTRWFGVLGPCRDIIRELEARGVQVIVFGQEDGHWQRYHNGTTRLERLRMRRSYVSIFSDVLDVVKLALLALRYQPSVIHSFNPKPSLLAFATAMFVPKARFLIGVTGLGNTFIRAKRLEGMVTVMLRAAAARASFIFFQNPDDRALFRERRIGTETKFRLFTGPGVDLTEFNRWTRPDRSDALQVRIICVARLIWQKGIREYVDAARAIRGRRGDSVEFLLVGDFDTEHPDSIPPQYIDEAVQSGAIRHIRWTDKLPHLLETCDVAVLHSYREGAPRAILEASAMCIPTVGANAIGVRELIHHERTGLLTALRSTAEVTAAIERLIDDPATRVRYGEEAYRLVAEPLSLANATRAQLEMYDGAI